LVITKATEGKIVRSCEWSKDYLISVANKIDDSKMALVVCTLSVYILLRKINIHEFS